MSRRKRKPSRSKYTRLVESDSEDDDFIPVTKKNSKIIKTARPSLQETAIRVSPDNKRDTSLSMKNSSLLDTSLIIENNSFSNDTHSEGDGEGEDEIDDSTCSNNNNNNHSIIIKVESLLTEKDNSYEREDKPSPLLARQSSNVDPMENIQLLKPHPLITPPPHWVPPGPTSGGCVLPRPSYKSTGPPIRVGLSRKAAIKPLHSHVIIKK